MGNRDVRACHQDLRRDRTAVNVISRLGEAGARYHYDRSIAGAARNSDQSQLLGDTDLLRVNPGTYINGSTDWTRGDRCLDGAEVNPCFTGSDNYGGLDS